MWLEFQGADTPNTLWQDCLESGGSMPMCCTITSLGICASSIAVKFGEVAQQPCGGTPESLGCPIRFLEK